MNPSPSRPREDRDHSVFISCSHIPSYTNIRDALTLAVLATGHFPTFAFAVEQTMPPTQVVEERLSGSRYSLHECTPCYRKSEVDVRRFNLPLELGMAFMERLKTNSNDDYHEVMLALKRGHPYGPFLLGLNNGSLISYSNQQQITSAVFEWLRQRITCTFAPKFELLEGIWHEFQETRPRSKGKRIIPPEESRDLLITICQKHDFWKSAFDVFLAYNSKDKEQVKMISDKLREKNINPWLDEEQVQPGRSFIQQIQTALPHCKSAAIFFSENGLGDWQARELESFMILSIKEDIPVIPVFLPSAAHNSELPGFLKSIRNVRFNNLDDSDSLNNLLWGITGVQH